MNENLTCTVSSTIGRHALLAEGDRVLLAVSGGADSVCMLKAFLELRDPRCSEILCAHLDHGIRDVSGEDAEFVRSLCAGLGVSCRVEQVDVEAHAAGSGLSLETAARELRYEFLLRVAKEHRADAVATAHTKDDQAETILFRLVRGSGPRGLAGIAYRSEREGVRIIRPMLDCRREEILGTLQKLGQRWREDATNHDNRFTRNRIRNQVIPYLKQHLNPSVPEVLSRTAAIFADEEDWLVDLTDDSLSDCRLPGEGHRLDAGRVDSLKLALRRRVLREWLRGGGVPMSRIDFDMLEAVVSLASAESGALSLGEGWRVGKTAGGLVLARSEPSLEPASFRVKLNIPGQILIREAGLCVEASFDEGFDLSESADIGGYPVTGWIDLETVGRSPVYVRNWQAGDRTRPLGMEGSVKLQDVFVDRKIPRAIRHRIPVLECRDQVAWVPGYRVDCRWAVRGPHAHSLKVSVGLA